MNTQDNKWINLDDNLTIPVNVLVWLYCEQRSNMGEALPFLGYFDEEDGMFYDAHGGFGHTVLPLGNNITHWTPIIKPEVPPLTAQACVEYYTEERKENVSHQSPHNQQDG